MGLTYAHTLLYIKQINNNDLLYSTANYIQYLLITYNGKESDKRYIYLYTIHTHPGGSVVKNLPANAGDAGLIPGSGRYPGGGNGNPLQYSCLENPMNKGLWQATVHGITKNQIRILYVCVYIYIYIYIYI